MRKITNEELHRPSVEEFAAMPKLPLVVVLDNVRSAQNVGSFFRMGDAFAVERIALCGITAVPPCRARYALVFGNEVEGVSQEAVDRCDGAVEIPQLGTKHSLNVSVSGGVVLWEFFCRIRSKA